MKKVLLPIEGASFSEGAFSFIKDYNEKQLVMVTAVLLPAVNYHDLLFAAGGIEVPQIPHESDKAGKYVEVQAHFEALCKANNIKFRIHADLGVDAVSQLKSETRFADLLVIGSELFYDSLGTAMQEDYIERILHKSECPVLLIPESYKPQETIIFAYDGGRTSMFAVKLFSYLFPEFSKMKMLIVNANADKSSMPELFFINEFAGCHFEKFVFEQLEADPQKYFNTWIANHGNAMLVTGAYGRSLFSQMLRDSFITETLRDHKLPIFIAHY